MKQTVRGKHNPEDYGYPTNNIESLVKKALHATQRLTDFYGEVPFSNKDVMSQLVDIVLSHRTKDEQTAAAYRALQQRFGSWEAVRDALVEEVQNAIANVNWPEVKAPRLQAIMRQITEERGNLNLDVLCQMPLEESSAWLNRFEGVGPKTTACVLLFSCQQPILPVDVHVHRVSGRLGLIGKKVTADNAHNLLQALLPRNARTIYNFHKGLLRHGQRVCVFERPHCNSCVVADICNYYAAVVQKTK